MKDFKQTAATQFISTSNDKQEVEKKQEVDNHKEELATKKKARAETKSRHLSLLVKPSTYAALKTQSKNKGLSVNRIINQIFEDYING